jgi:hypothetical protein
MSDLDEGIATATGNLSQRPRRNGGTQRVSRN